MAKVNEDEKNLIRRYLIWCYKTTKEELDRVDRKFTQLRVDRNILKELSKDQVEGRRLLLDGEYQKLLKEFEGYIRQKEKDAFTAKFTNKKSLKLVPRYEYLMNRLRAIEKTIISMLGKKELRRVVHLYEEEMISRILQSREHA